MPARVGAACGAGPGAGRRGPSGRRPGRAAGRVHGAHDRAAAGHSGGDGLRHERDRRGIPRLGAGPAQAGQRDRRRYRGLLAGVRAQARRRLTGRRPMSGRLPQLVLALAAAGACASSNAMWSARVVPLESRDRGRRSRAAYLAGRAAVLRGDVPAALERLAGSEDAAAGFTRARLLAAAGRTGEVAALLDTLTRRRFAEGEWAAALDDVARASGPDVAAHTLDRLLARQRVRDRERARLLLADGNRQLPGGELDAAQRRYAQAERAAPDSVEGQRARLLLVRVTASRAERPDELAAVARRLTGLLQSGPGGPVDAEALAFQETVRRVLVLDASGDAALFRAAELARDSLGSAPLAGWLFLRIVTLAPSSLFAPKALVAAAGLLPQSHDSLVALLSSRYPTSPYTLATKESW